MRIFGLFLLLALIPALAVAGDKDTKAIAPAEAAKMVDKVCTVEMEVKSIGKSKDVFFLNSKEDFKDKENFTVFLNKEGVASLKESKVEDPAAHFKGKTIRVTGKVVLYREKGEIIVDKASAIELVEAKKPEKDEKK